MAGELNDQRTPFNPLCISGTAMQPQVLLMSKLALAVAVTGGVFDDLDRPLAPLIGALDPLASSGIWLALALKAAFLVAAAFLFVNRGVRSAAGVLGILVLYTQSASAAAFGSHQVVCGALLTLGALQPRSEQPWLVRGLVSTVLATGAILRAGDHAWLDGTTIESWVTTGVAHPVLAWLRAFVGGPWVSQAAAWIILVAEVAIAICLLIPVLRRAAAWCLAFHLLISGFTLAIPAMQAASVAIGIAGLSFLQWPKGAIAVLWPRACGFPLWLRIALDRYDFDGRLDWPLPPDPDAILEVDIDERHSEDVRALSALLLHFPVFLFAAFLVIWGTHLLLSLASAALAHVIVVGPLLGLFALRRLKHARRRLQSRIASSSRS